jgi:hypothetical protein
MGPGHEELVPESTRHRIEGWLGWKGRTRVSTPTINARLDSIPIAGRDKWKQAARKSA